MLAQLSNELKDQIQALKKSVLSKDDVVCVGQIYTDDIKEAVDKWPVLFHPRYFNNLIQAIRKLIPNSLVVHSWTNSDKQIKVYVSDSSIPNFPKQDCNLKGSKLVYEDAKKYCSRLYKWCEDNNLNIIYYNKIGGIWHDEIAIY